MIEQLAANHPDWTFTLAGDSNYISPNQNVGILGKQSNTELLALYNSHQFYLQRSTSEGFPNTLGEAMACGCVPSGSAVGAIPEIIGGAKLILQQKSISDLEQLLTHLDQDESFRKFGEENTQAFYLFYPTSTASALSFSLI